MLKLHELSLAGADAVLAGAGAVHRNRALDEAFVEGFSFGHLRRIRGIDAKTHVKVAISHMADRGDEKGSLLHILVRLLDAFRQRSRGHANVGAPDLRVWSHCHDGVVDVVTRLP